MSDNDKKRDKAIYRYLFNSFAIVRDKNALERDKKENINFRQTARRFGQDNSDFTLRIYNDIHDITQNYSAAKLTTGKLVELITGLYKGGNNELDKSHRSDEQIPKLLKLEDILTVFKKLTELSSEEKERLGLSNFTEELLLQQILLNLGIYHKQINKETVLKLYKASIGLNFEIATDITSSSENYVNSLIRQTAEDILSYIPPQWSHKQKKINDLTKKVESAIEQIEFQAGIKNNDELIKQDFTKKYLTPNFIKAITRSVIENQILNEDFPIYIRSFKIEQLQPLPLRVQYGLLNPELLLTEEKINNSGLESQYAYKVTVHFCLKKTTGESQDFYVTSSGVGGQLSQIVKVINKALFWDIECFRDKYFPIVHDLIINHEIIQNSMTSPVWAHSLVQLCTLDSIQDALINNNKYEQISFLDEVGRGDYCTFDFLEAAGKSALQARLKAIKNTGEDPSKYLRNLGERVQRVDLLNKAESYLNFYPFSLNAMESHLEESLLKSPLNDRINLQTLCHYDAYISIIDGYLTEGLYRNAYRILKQISHLKEISEKVIKWDIGESVFNSNEGGSDKFKFFSSVLLIRYSLSRANYFYLLDTKDNKKPEYIDPEPHNYERATYVKLAWQSLKDAETHLKIRIKKYHCINEVSQSLFHPYFLLLSNINFLRAKLFLFFPQDAINNIDDGDSPLKDKNYGFHYGRIYFLEKARLDAARNGESELYSCYTAYQSWGYIMAGYLVKVDNSIILGTGNQQISVNFEKNNCLRLAKILIEHSLKSYAETGRKAYYQIKEKSGVTSIRSYGNRKIENIPPIRETERDSCSENSEECLQGFHENILYIDMSLLWIQELNGQELDYSEKIYLFGTKACTILFSLGSYELCSPLGQSIYPDNEKDDWQTKILRAYRLFSYAWAIAEDGGKTVIEDGEPKKYGIERPDFRERHLRDPHEYHSPEVDSVRDLYPHRITEIADLGRVYATACNLILMYISTQDNEQEERRDDIRNLQNKFHCISRMLPELAEHQPRFNGHLATYLRRVKQIVNRELNQVSNHKEDRTLNVNIENFRSRIIEDLFASFYRDPKV